nr:tumor necrosis factor ligand superfamily member 6-like [Biomphalaria glabrata]
MAKTEIDENDDESSEDVFLAVGNFVSVLQSDTKQFVNFKDLNIKLRHAHQDAVKFVECLAPLTLSVFIYQDESSAGASTSTQSQTTGFIKGVKELTSCLCGRGEKHAGGEVEISLANSFICQNLKSIDSTSCNIQCKLQGKLFKVERSINENKKSKFNVYSCDANFLQTISNFRQSFESSLKYMEDKHNGDSTAQRVAITVFKDIDDETHVFVRTGQEVTRVHNTSAGHSSDWEDEVPALEYVFGSAAEPEPQKIIYKIKDKKTRLNSDLSTCDVDTESYLTQDVLHEAETLNIPRLLPEDDLERSGNNQVTRKVRVSIDDDRIQEQRPNVKVHYERNAQHSAEEEDIVVIPLLDQIRKDVKATKLTDNSYCCNNLTNKRISFGITACAVLTSLLAFGINVGLWTHNKEFKRSETEGVLVINESLISLLIYQKKLMQLARLERPKRMKHTSISAHKSLSLPPRIPGSEDKKDPYFKKDYNVCVRINMSHNPTDHARGVTLDIDGLIIQYSGLYFLYSSVTFKPNSTDFSASFAYQTWFQYIYKMRPNSPAHSTVLTRVVHTCCLNCTNSQNTAYSGGAFYLEAGDMLQESFPNVRLNFTQLQ